ncbi:hypothetical protein BM221_005760 [Beauveria bassiana]|uniref:Uncharacterized protein n=1 Tax=Beauveria bassiana TaxID=176275 RepID=A0A2N6NPI6_BEABA|nr:hypothetical protein BM221_005760 [Beauveria bassiana]
MSSLEAVKNSNVWGLHTRLDCGDNTYDTLRRCMFSYKDCHSFIRRYVDVNGISGSLFWDQNSKRDVEGVDTMAAVFLETDGRGNYWWPDDSNHV